MTTSFGADGTPPADVAPATVNENGTIIVGDRVYTPEALAKKLTSQDQHIANLETENANHISSSTELLNRLESVEQKVSDKGDISSLLETLKQNQTEPPAGTDNTEDPGDNTAVSKEDLVAATMDRINDQNRESTEQTNLVNAIAAAKALYGDDFSTTIDKMGEEMGMDVDAVINMAKTQPSVWAKLFTPSTDKSGSPDPTKTSSLPGNTPPPATEKRGGYVAMRSNKDQRAEFKRRMDAALSPKQ